MKEPIHRLFRRLQPGYLSGFGTAEWIRLLWRNSWDVDPEYWPRALMATAGSICTTLIAPFESLAARTATLPPEWQRPLFVLGPPRSGTTFLFNLLAHDPSFAFPTRLDCYNPHTFLVLRRLGLHRLLARVAPRGREMDEMVTGWLSPEEDSIAMTILTGHDVNLGDVFPRHRCRYHCQEHCDSRDPSSARMWQDALVQFVRKLSSLHNKPLVLKSPWHTISIPEILQVFAGARFVTIHRNPLSHFGSLLQSSQPENSGWITLQRGEPVGEPEVLDRMSRLLRRYFQTRSLIPSENLVEIRYEDLVERPTETLKRVYSGLRLPEASLPRVVEAVPASYAPNQRPLPPERSQKMIRSAYQPLYAAGVYE